MIPARLRLVQGDGLALLSLPAGGHMFLTLCKSKLHRATVTQAELHYEGSITIDSELLAAASILPFERVQVVDIANGARFETYAIEGNAGSHTVCVNGAAARLVQVGDPIIVISYAQMTPDEAARHHPTIVLLNADNSIRETLAGDRTTPIEILSESLGPSRPRPPSLARCSATRRLSPRARPPVDPPWSSSAPDSAACAPPARLARRPATW